MQDRHGGKGQRHQQKHDGKPPHAQIIDKTRRHRGHLPRQIGLECRGRELDDAPTAAGVAWLCDDLIVDAKPAAGDREDVGAGFATCALLAVGGLEGTFAVIRIDHEFHRIRVAVSAAPGERNRRAIEDHIGRCRIESEGSRHPVAPEKRPALRPVFNQLRRLFFRYQIGELDISNIDRFARLEGDVKGQPVTVRVKIDLVDGPDRNARIDHRDKKIFFIPDADAVRVTGGAETQSWLIRKLLEIRALHLVPEDEQLG